MPLDRVVVMPIPELTQEIVMAVSKYRQVDENSPEVFDVFYVIWQSIVFADMAGVSVASEVQIAAVLSALDVEFGEREKFFTAIIGRGDPDAANYFYIRMRDWAVEFYRLMQMYELLKISDDWEIELPYQLLSFKNGTLFFNDLTERYT